MRQYREWIAGILVYFIVFAVLLAATNSVVLALLLGAVLGAGAGLLAYSMFPSDPELVEYQQDVRRRVKSVFKTTDEIADLAKQFHDRDSQQALLKGCEVIRDLLSLAQKKDPDNMAATAAKVGVYLSSVKNAADAHVQIEAHPDYWPNATELLAANAQGFRDFQSFAISTVQQLNQGEATALRANLNVLKPMTTPALTS